MAGMMVTWLQNTEKFSTPRARARFLARHPKARLYAGFGDFAMFRMAVEGAHLNGGFARAMAVSGEDLLTRVDDAESLVTLEEGAIAHMNADHADALALYATRLAGAPEAAWRATGRKGASSTAV